MKHNTYQSSICIIALCLSLALMNGCQRQPSAYKETVYAMDTVMNLTVYADSANGQETLQEMKAEIHRLDQLWSANLEGSEVNQLNQNGTATVSDDTLAVMKEALQINRETDGAFDVTILPLVQAWGFYEETMPTKRPESSALREALSYVDSSKIVMDDHTITLGDGQSVEFGAIAKGYTSNRLLEIMEEHQVSYAIVDLGGNIQTYGTKTDGQPFQIGIQNPFTKDADSFIVLRVEGGMAVVTSGAYERYYQLEDGTIIHHIIDPATGAPAESDLASVTIIAKDAMRADALSTALYVMGFEKACDYWRMHSDEFAVVFVTADGNVWCSQNIAAQIDAEKFEIVENDGK